MLDDAGNVTSGGVVDRYTGFHESYLGQARKLCLAGFTDKELATYFEVSPSTFSGWLVAYPELARACAKGREYADGNVAHAFYKRATGFKTTEIHFSVIQNEVVQTEYIKQYPPDASAALKWLQNRQPDKWQERVVFTGKNGGPIETATVTIAITDPVEASRAYQKLMEGGVDMPLASSGPRIDA